MKFANACIIVALGASAWLAYLGTAAAQNAADEVLAETGKATVTRADYEAELLRLPPDVRGNFANDPKRVAKLLDNLLATKILAAEAREAGIDREPSVRERLALETDRFLSQLQLQRMDEAAGAAFDAKRNAFQAKAHERYLIDKEKYADPEQITASHILFDVRSRTPDAARALAETNRAKLVAGADFATLAKAVSDDPSAAENGGRLPWFAASQMDPAFSKAAFALKNVGDLSEPVQSRFGYHLIRLEGRRPARQWSFDEAKGPIMAELRERYIAEQREAKLNAIRNNPATKVNQAAIDSLMPPPIDPKLLVPTPPPAPQ